MIEVFHNPRCTKSREAVELLKSRGIEFEEIRYLDDPPSAKVLRQVIKKLGIKPEQLVRKKEKLYKELDLDAESFTDRDWIDVMVANPKLIERPIVIQGDKAAIGRPIDNIVDLLDS
ncbi:arsenate reductase (glutaredoxin) [Rhodopirellula sp. MGV]|uniref:arsenate reductase (glutaredoxin) n=1 Tax=Rhodopirellula sp. MGV TaxID=2023130 RepID=UPI000B963ACA|nr:arsenate reductase (glutaredoxin) [Rhodopirellula sp. MGV]OYP36560.1 arsenate reductase (glutaredoxin) [Rhodopirellula sp. MGV]PNY34536.1 arsenate reductase (glutaredoxin) [Rhodopirellula baltica]